MTTLEKAVKAMYDANEKKVSLNPSRQVWEERSEYVRLQWAVLARAAIESLRTPGIENTDRIFNAMLDRILEEEEV